MTFRHKSASFKVLFTFAVIPILLAWTGAKGVAHAGIGSFLWPIAGTYLETTGERAQIMQISADGNISFITSDQFAGLGVLGESYSDSLGSWKWTGPRKITAELLDVSVNKTSGTFEGVAAYTAYINFSYDLKTAELICEGAIYEPGVDPYEPGVQPIEGSEFHCGTMVFHRVGVRGYHGNYRF